MATNVKQIFVSNVNLFLHLVINDNAYNIQNVTISIEFTVQFLFSLTTKFSLLIFKEIKNQQLMHKSLRLIYFFAGEFNL